MEPIKRIKFISHFLQGHLEHVNRVPFSRMWAIDQLNKWLEAHDVEIVSICETGDSDDPTIVLYYR